MDRNRRRRSDSVPFARREERPFSELLSNTARFSIRFNRRKQSDEYQVRIGTSPRNSFGVPVDKLEVLYKHIGELLEKKKEKIEELKERRKDVDQTVDAE